MYTSTESKWDFPLTCGALCTWWWRRRGRATWPPCRHTRPGAKTPQGMGGKTAPSSDPEAQKEREKLGIRQKSSQIQYHKNNQWARTRPAQWQHFHNPPKDEDDELSICTGTAYCADEICKPNTNECQGNVFELERCPNQHKRVTTLSSEYSSPCIYILHFRHLADTLSRSDWVQQ